MYVFMFECILYICMLGSGYRDRERERGRQTGRQAGGHAGRLEGRERIRRGGWVREGGEGGEGEGTRFRHRPVSSI